TTDEAHAPDDESVADAEVLPDFHTRELERRRHRHAGVWHECNVPPATVSDFVVVRLLPIVAACGALMLAGCGSSSSSSGAAASTNSSASTQTTSSAATPGQIGF